LRHQGSAAPRTQGGRDDAASTDRKSRHAPRHDVTGASPAIDARTQTVNGFGYVDGELRAEDVPLSSVAERFGTPCYVYSRALLTQAYRSFDAAFAGLPHLVCYAMKANPTLAILDLFAQLGSGFDIVSGGELERVMAAGGDSRKVVFSGVGKSETEMEAALAAGILCFNVESASELEHLAAVGRRLGVRAPISFRVNPDVDPLTHPYISTGLKESKFGVAFADAHALYRRAAQLPSIEVRGIDMHIGSQITELAPYREAAGRMLSLVDALASEGIALDHVDLVRLANQDHPVDPARVDDRVEPALVLGDHAREQQVVAARGNRIRQWAQEAHEERVRQVLLGLVADRQDHADRSGPAQPQVPRCLVDLEPMLLRQRLDARPGRLGDCVSNR
jgi:hypothetical protein